MPKSKRTKKREKSKLWWFTQWNLDFDYEKLYQETTATYIAYGYEETPSEGTPHHQGVIHFSGQRGSIKGVAKDLGSNCKVGMCNGNIDQNIDYCSKGEGQFTEIGTKPKPGRRTDLNLLKNEIMTGATTVDKVAIENPAMFHQYGRTLSKIEDILLRKQYRTWMTKGVWIWGPTGTGKSHEVYDGFNPETHYRYPFDGGWWDGYTGQEIVIFDDMRGELRYNQLMTLVDKWPRTVRRRNREPAPFLAKEVRISSSRHPGEIYYNEESLDEFLRRFDIKRFTLKASPEGGKELAAVQRLQKWLRGALRVILNLRAKNRAKLLRKAFEGWTTALRG